MYKKVLVFLTAVLMLLSLSTSVDAQMCRSSSFYNTIAWNWSYLGPCTNSYNCLGYATGSNTWEWPWGSSLPTTSQVDNYLYHKHYMQSLYKKLIVSYGSSSGITHFSKITGPSTCEAKFGGLNLMSHTTWDPYVASGSYGPKVAVYAKAFSVSISGPSVFKSSTAFLEWTANPSDGYPGYSYEWTYCTDGVSFNIPLGTEQTIFPMMLPSQDIYLRVKVTDSNGTIRYQEMKVTYDPSPGSGGFRVKSSDNTLKNYIAEMEFNIQNNPNSSNPYDYCNNPGFRKIVAMGPAALKQIENYINRSSENGLTEYMLAIAAEEIAAVDLKKQPEKWINGKKWALNWNKFLRRLPSRVDSILADSDQESSKISKLEALGFAALPILEDKIREGNTSLLKPFHNILGKMKSESEELHRRAVKTDNIISTYRELLNRHK